MQYIGKAIATVAIWGGECGILWELNSFNMLNWIGAGFIFLMGMMLTAAIWDVLKQIRDFLE